MARSFLTKTESLSSAGYSNKGIVEKYGSIGAFLTKLEEFAELNEEIQEDVVELQNAVEAADEVEAVVEQQETNVAAMEGEEISSEPVKIESDGGEIIEVTPAQPDLSENSTPEEVTDVIVAEETKVERILQRLSRDQVRSKSEILGIYGINCHKIRTEDIRSNSLYVYKQKMEENKNFLARIWEKIAAFFKKIWETIKNFFKGKAVEAKVDKIEEQKEDLKNKVSSVDFKIDESMLSSKIKDGKLKMSATTMLSIELAKDMIAKGSSGKVVEELTKSIKTYTDNLKKQTEGLGDIKAKKDFHLKLINGLIEFAGGKDETKGRSKIKPYVQNAVLNDLHMEEVVRSMYNTLPKLNSYVEKNYGDEALKEINKADNEFVDTTNKGYIAVCGISASSISFISNYSFKIVKLNIDDDMINSTKISDDFSNLAKQLGDFKSADLASSIKKMFQLVEVDINGIISNAEKMTKVKEDETSYSELFKGLPEDKANKSKALTQEARAIIAEIIKRAGNTLLQVLTGITQLVTSIDAVYSFCIKVYGQFNADKYND